MIDRHASLRGAILLLLGAAGILRAAGSPPAVLPAAARAQLARSLEASRPHQTHSWRDTAAVNEDGSLNAYIEIARGDHRKWEYHMGRNARVIDRVMPPEVGAYPVNYGFLPQTISYDGDPFDALVLGPPIPGGRLVRGRVLGMMHMDDEKGHDSKVVLSSLDENGRATHELTARDRDEMRRFFERYKRHEPGKFSKFSGWGSVVDARAYVRITQAFFQHCREPVVSPCRLQ